MTDIKDIQEHILKILTDEGPIFQQELLEKMDASAKDIKYALRRLKEKNKIDTKKDFRDLREVVLVLA